MTDEPKNEQRELTQDEGQLFHTLMLHLVEGVLKEAAIAAAELDVSVTEADGEVLTVSKNLLEVLDRIMPELSDAIEAAIDVIPGAVSAKQASEILDMLTSGAIALPGNSNNGNGEILH